MGASRSELLALHICPPCVRNSRLGTCMSCWRLFLWGDELGKLLEAQLSIACITRGGRGVSIGLGEVGGGA